MDESAPQGVKSPGGRFALTEAFGVGVGRFWVYHHSENPLFVPPDQFVRELRQRFGNADIPSQLIGK